MPDNELEVQTGVEDAAAAEQGISEGVVEQKQEQIQENPEVAAFKAKALDETKKRQQAEQDAQLYRDQLAIMQANSQRTAQPVQQKTLTRQVIEELGYQDEQFLTTEQHEAVIERIIQVQNSRASQSQFLNQRQDFFDVVGKVNPLTGRFEASEHLKSAMTDNPEMMGIDQLVATNPAYAPMAYALAKQAKVLAETKKKAGDLTALELAEQTQRGLTNKLSPMSPAAAGGGGITSNIDARIAAMKPNSSEFAELQARVAAGEFDQT